MRQIGSASTAAAAPTNGRESVDGRLRGVKILEIFMATPTTRSPQEARQGETGLRTFIVLMVSTLIAAGLAAGAYFYVFAEDNPDLRGDIPAATSVDENPVSATSVAPGNPGAPQITSGEGDTQSLAPAAADSQVPPQE